MLFRQIKHSVFRPLLTTPLLLLFAIALPAQQPPDLQSQPSQESPAAQDNPAQNTPSQETPAQETMALPPQFQPAVETALPEAAVSSVESSQPGEADGIPEQQQTVEQDYESLYYDYQSFFSEDEFGQAVVIGKKMLQLVESRTGPNDLRLFEPLINLAAAQRRANQPEASVENFERAIELIENESGIYDLRLIEPLQEMGDVYRATARNEDALDTLRRAQHITHRKDGVMTIEQEDILDGITEAYLALGMYEEANREQVLSMRTYVHEFGADDVRMIPAIHKLAQFEMRIGQYRYARELYQRSLHLMEQNYEENDIRKLEPLEGIALSRRSPYQGVRDLGEPGPGLTRVRLANAQRSQGTKALERSLQIVDSREDVDAEDRVTALLNLADWRIEGNEPDKAATLYKRAWVTWVDGGKSPESVQQYFSKPRQLAYSAPSLPTEIESGRYVNYDGKFVEIEFTVTADGEVRGVTVVDSNSPVVMHRKMRDTMRDARYRPALFEGVPVDTPGVRFRQTFSGTADIWRKP